MKMLIPCAGLAAALLMTIPAASAPLPTGPGPAGVNAAMTKLFGEFTAFSARSEVRLKDKGQQDSMVMWMDFAMLDGKIRADIDLAQVRSQEMPPQALATLKQVGMDKMTTIVRPEKRLTLVIYPALKMYVEVPMSRQDAEELEGTFKLEKAPLGTETVDGHACEKCRVTVTNEKGGKSEAIVWYATDLKQFPVQMQIQQADGAVVMLYRNVKLEKPDAKQFEVPASFARQPTVEKLMQDAMTKAAGQLPK